jgi:peptidyl-tRNA hydrolase
MSLKQVIVVNESLALPRGKLAAQVAHASVASLLMADPSNLQVWLNVGMPKIVLASPDEDDLVQCYERALAAKLPAYLVRDAGRTVIEAGTVTSLGIGPAPDEDINAITGEYRLVK